MPDYNIVHVILGAAVLLNVVLSWWWRQKQLDLWERQGTLDKAIVDSIDHIEMHLFDRRNRDV